MIILSIKNIRGTEKMDNKSNITTLAIIPCYNEAATIGSMVIKAKRHVDKVLVVDDGSIDDTANIAKAAGAHVILHKKNYGKSIAIKTGFKYASEHGFDYVITIDGDGQHNPDEIPLVLGNLMNNGHDITVGYRSGSNTEMPRWRKVGKRVLDYSTSLGNGGYVTDSQNGFRAFNKRAVTCLIPELNGDAFSVESEQLIKAHKLGLGVTHTNVTCRYKDLKKTSSKNPTSHGFSVLTQVIWLVAEKRPLLFLSLPGFILVIFGLLLGFQTLKVYNETHLFLLPQALIVSCLLIIGVIAMFMGLMLNVLPHIVRQSNKEKD